MQRKGLVVARQARGAGQLGAFLASYIAQRTDLKRNTVRNLETSRVRLVEFFGQKKPLADISSGDADTFLLWLRARYASGTASLTVKRAKQFFRAAVRER